jgi:hypothetical protein
MAKRKSTRKPKLKPEQDEAIVAACVTYVQAVSAWKAGYKADPDGNCATANRLGDAQRRKADKALELATTPAKTTTGLSAKSRVMGIMLAHEYDGFDCVLTETDRKFIEAFTVDCQAHFDELGRREWRSKNEPARAEGGAT